MQWFVETTIAINGVAQPALVDMVALLQPFLRLADARAAGDGDYTCDHQEFWRLSWPDGRADLPAPAPAPEPSKLVVLGWKTEARQTIMLIKLARHWTKSDLTTAKRLVDQLSYGPDWRFTLDLTSRPAQEVSQLRRELDEIGVRYETRHGGDP